VRSRISKRVVTRSEYDTSFLSTSLSSRSRTLTGESISEAGPWGVSEVKEAAAGVGDVVERADINDSTVAGCAGNRALASEACRALRLDIKRRAPALGPNMTRDGRAWLRCIGIVVVLTMILAGHRFEDPC